jgi:hypothetical protein
MGKHGGALSKLGQRGRDPAETIVTGPAVSSFRARVFLGLGGITVTVLRAEDLTLGFVGPPRALLLGGAATWSIVLAWRIAGLATANSASIIGNPLDCFRRFDRRRQLGHVFLGLAVTGRIAISDSVSFACCFELGADLCPRWRDRDRISDSRVGPQYGAVSAPQSGYSAGGLISHA